MSKTALLPTVTAVRMVWAMSGKFSNDAPSQTMATYVEDVLKGIEEQAPQISDDERSYVTSAVATMKASLRSIDVVYKGRDLNFKENEKLRSAYLESVKESLDFGNKAQDFLKSLPAMTIAGAGGVTVAQYFKASAFELWGFGLILTGIGYFVNQYIVLWVRRKTQMLYVTQDYERGLYYEQYLDRVHLVLLALFLDLERIHKRVFRENYEADTTSIAVQSIIDDILSGVRSTFCPYAHKHMAEKKVTPELWTLCESGTRKAVKNCPLWEG
jgi:hypothetical protein